MEKNRERKKKKKGVSPLIATVLLIVVAISLFTIIFLWIRGFQRESILKFGTPIETTCMSLNYEIKFHPDKTLEIINNGNFQIFRADVYITDQEGSTKKLGVTDGDLLENILPASSARISVSDCEKIKVIPVLLGTTQAGAEKEHACENQAKTILC